MNRPLLLFCITRLLYSVHHLHLRLLPSSDCIWIGRITPHPFFPWGKFNRKPTLQDDESTNRSYPTDHGVTAHDQVKGSTNQHSEKPKKFTAIRYEKWLRLLLGSHAHYCNRAQRRTTPSSNEIWKHLQTEPGPTVYLTWNWKGSGENIKR